MISLGTAAGNDPGLLKHVQVMGEEIGRHGEHDPKLRGRRVSLGQRVSDQQPGLVGKRCVDRYAPRQVIALLRNH